MLKDEDVDLIADGETSDSGGERAPNPIVRKIQSYSAFGIQEKTEVDFTED